MHDVVGLITATMGSRCGPVVGRTWRSLVRRRIDDLREVSLSSDLLRRRALLGCLRVDLLLLHRVVLRGVVDWQFVQAAAGLAVLGRANCLRLPKSVIRRILAHHRLDLPLVVETGNLRYGLAVLAPEAVNRALARSLLPLGVLSAFSFGLLRRDFDRVRTAIGLLFRLLLLICSAQVLTHHDWVLIESRVGTHSHPVPSLARRQLSVLVILIVDVTQRGVRLGLLVLHHHLLLSHLG